MACGVTQPTKAIHRLEESKAAELFSGNVIRSELIHKLTNRFSTSQLIYELPVVVIPGVTRDYKHEIATWSSLKGR